MRRLIILMAALLVTPLVTADEFLMQDLAAERVDLLDFTGDGQWTLVMFWSTDCIPCEQQKPMVEAFHQAHRADRAHVVGVALDGYAHIAAIEALVARHQPSYPNLVAYADVIQRQYTEHVGTPLTGTPTYLLYAPDGTLKGSHVGPMSRAALDAAVGG